MSYDSAGGTASTNYTSRKTYRQTVLSTLHGRWLIPILRFCISDYNSFEESNFMYKWAE